MAIKTLGSPLGYLNRLFVEGTVSGLPDDQLLDRFLATREGAAFEALMTRHGPMVLRACRAVLRNPSDAEDAFQAAFLVLVRRAHTLRGHANLGGWLYMVAYRVAIQANAAAARRRVQERRAGEMSASTSSHDPIIPDELVPALHKEIARLPEKIRLAVVLCELQGVPQAQAAEALRWSTRTLQRRLAEGRERLTARLGRRGMGCSGAVLAAVRLRDAGTVIPPAWRESTLRAALDLLNSTVAAGAVSTAAQALTHEVFKMMFLRKLAIATATLMGAGLMAWAASAARATPKDDPPKAAAPVAQRAAPITRPAVGDDPLDETGILPIRGRVLDPDGRPVAGAELYVHHRAQSDVAPPGRPDRREGGTTSADGRFRFDLDKAASDWPGEGAAWREAQIAAVAPGLGAAWTDAGTAASEGEATLRMVRDDIPIRGRLVDVQGRPVTGATIKAFQLGAPKEGRDLDAMLASGEYGGSQTDASFPTPTYLGRQGIWTTDADGRFEIKGVGRDRIIGLEITGPALEKLILYAMARQAKASPRPRPRPSIPPGMPRELFQPPPPQLVGSTFEAVAGPTKPILGIIRLKGKGRPIAGARIFGFEPATGIQVAGVSDAEGRFRLVGLPKSGSYLLRVEPRAGDPYLGAAAEVTDTSGLAPIEANLELPPGVPITGRLIDEATGEPVRAMHVMHLKLPANRHEGQAGIARISAHPKAFLITVPPGEGALLASVPGRDDRFVLARLREGDRNRGVGGLDENSALRCNAYKIVDVPADTRSLSVDLPLNRGRSLKGRLIDSEGRSVVGAGAYGLSARWGSTRTLPSDTFEVGGLEPDHPRRVIFTHRGRKLAGAVVLLDEDMKAGRPLEVRLVPTGSIKGRLVDEDGLPVAGAKLHVVTFDLDGNNLPFGEARALWPSDQTFATVADGRFWIEGLVPGIETDVRIDAPTRLNLRLDTGDALRRLTVSPGKIRDLGDVKTREARPQ